MIVTTTPDIMRRSTRIPLVIPVLLTSLDPRTIFSERCQTIVVNSHGCGLRSSRAIPTGIPVRLEILTGKGTATARIVGSAPVGTDRTVWMVGVELDQPGNIWGVHPAPLDWQSQTARGQDHDPAEPAGCEALPPVGGTASGLSVWPFSSPSQPQIPNSQLPGSAPPPALPRVPASPPASDEISQAKAEAERLELELHEEIRTVSAQLEGSYRKEPVDLTVHEPADQKECAPVDSQRLYDEAREKIQELVVQARQEIIQAARNELDKSVEALHVSLQQRLGNEFDQRQMQLVHTSERLRAEIEGLHARTEELPSWLDTNLGPRLDRALRDAVARGELDRSFEAVREALSTQARAKLESTLTPLLERAQSGSEELRRLLEELQNEQEQETLAAQRSSAVKQVDESLSLWRQEMAATQLDALRGLHDEVQNQVDNCAKLVGEKLSATCDQVMAQARKELKTITAEALEGIQNRSAETAKASDELSRIEQVLSARQQELISSLEERSQQLMQGVRSELPKSAEALHASFQQRLGTEFDHRHMQLVQTSERLRAEIEGLHARSEELSSRLDTNLGPRLEQALNDTVNRAREELDRSFETVQDALRTQAQAQLEGTLASLLDRAQSGSQELRQLLEALPKEQETWAAQRDSARQQAQACLQKDTEEFRKLVRDVLVDAAGQIKGRIHQALETLEESIQRCGNEVKGELEGWAANRSQEAIQQLEQMRQHMLALRVELENSLDSSIRERMAESRKSFQGEITKVVEQSIDRWQNALNEAVQALPQLLHDKIAPRS